MEERLFGGLLPRQEQCPPGTGLRVLAWYRAGSAENAARLDTVRLPGASGSERRRSGGEGADHAYRSVGRYRANRLLPISQNQAGCATTRLRRRATRPCGQTLRASTKRRGPPAHLHRCRTAAMIVDMRPLLCPRLPSPPIFTKPHPAPLTRHRLNTRKAP